MKLFAVVVVYKMQPCKSPSLRSLTAGAKVLDPEVLQLSVMVWDNTPGGQDRGEIPHGVLYRAAPNNPGLSAAYNWCVKAAEASGCDWLLTLDQDTELPPDFLQSICRIANSPDLPPDVCGIVPRVIGDGRELSPFLFVCGAIPRMLHDQPRKTLWSKVYAVNSAATLRVSSILSVGGYNPLFPLDISDMDLFRRFSMEGMRVYFAADMVVSHNFSLLKKHERMSLDRYDRQLMDECAFWDLHMGLMGRLERLVRLAGRACIDWWKGNDSSFRKRTVSELLRRLSTSRTGRLSEWRRLAEQRACRAKSGSEHDLGQC